MFRVYRVPTAVGALSLMPCPPAAALESCLAALKEQNVRIVVSMLPAPEAAELGMAQEDAFCARHGMTLISHPVPDFGLPQMRPFSDLVHWISSKILAGAHVAVHCRAGIGRSGMVAAAVLVALGETSDQAQHIVSAARGVSIPDTVEQGAFIAEYARHMSQSDQLSN